MKKCRCFLLMLSVFFLFPCMVYASEESDNYDYRNETIQKSEDYDGISELTDDIIQELYEINGIDTYDNGETAIDISNATKVFAYNSENFLALLKDNHMVEKIQNHTNYCWKIPIDDTDGVVYTVAYLNANNEWSYYTASSDFADGKNQVQYIFEKDKISEILSENQIQSQQLFAVTVSEIGLDCLIADAGTEVFVIPYAARPDFLDIINGQVYSQKEIYEKVNTYMTELSYDYTGDEGGGVGYSDSSYLYVWYGLGLTVLGVIVYLVLRYFFIRKNKSF